MNHLDIVMRRAAVAAVCLLCVCAVGCSRTVSKPDDPTSSGPVSDGAFAEDSDLLSDEDFQQYIENQDRESDSQDSSATAPTGGTTTTPPRGVITPAGDTKAPNTTTVPTQGDRDTPGATTGVTDRGDDPTTTTQNGTTSSTVNIWDQNGDGLIDFTVK